MFSRPQACPLTAGESMKIAHIAIAGIAAFSLIAAVSLQLIGLGR
jgi:hypothetical protein